jgi:hypothetical protein
MLIAALVLSHEHFEDAEKDPILFSFQAFEVELDDIPFPSVSACDSSSLQSTQIENINR